MAQAITRAVADYAVMAQCAYELYEQRGWQDGRELEDWLRKGNRTEHKEKTKGAQRRGKIRSASSCSRAISSRSRVSSIPGPGEVLPLRGALCWELSDRVIMEMTWENLTKLFMWAAQHGSEAPMADTAGGTILIDGAITKEDLDRFMASHSEPLA
jgi:hypothetical protein